MIRPQPLKPPEEFKVSGAANGFKGKLEAVIVNDRELHGLSASGIEIDQCQLNKVIFSEARISGWSISDTVIKNCLFFGCILGEGTFIRDELTQCRMTGIDFSGSSLRDVVFKECKLDGSNFRMCKFLRCEFVDCEMTEADFYGCQINHLNFESCNLTRGQFSASTSKQLDLRGCDLTGLNGLLSLSGALIDSNQAMSLGSSLLREVGVTIDNSY